MEFSTLAPVVVVLACSNAQSVAVDCAAEPRDMPVVTTREILVCELRAKVSRKTGTAAFAASCARGARMETRNLPRQARDDGEATVLAAVFY